MMVAVSILGIGVVLISRSFLTSVSVLESLQNRVAAAYFLCSRMGELEEKSLQSDGLKTEEAQEEVEFGSRKADFKKEITAIDVDVMADNLNRVKLGLYWTESGRAKDEALVTYMPNKK
jgi:hypothetical protein